MFTSYPPFLLANLPIARGRIFLDLPLGWKPMSDGSDMTSHTAIQLVAVKAHGQQKLTCEIPLKLSIPNRK